MPSFRSYPTVGISRVLFATAASLFLSSSAVAQTVEIKLSANETLNAIIGSEDSIYFEPYSPAPTEPTSCSEECPCMFPGDEVCGCDLETVCGGTIPLDLSVGNTLEFRWDASMNGDKLLAINGTERTRVEFRAHIEDCEMPYQEITGDMIVLSWTMQDWMRLKNTPTIPTTPILIWERAMMRKGVRYLHSFTIRSRREWSPQYEVQEP
eukprot:36623_1